ncbi:MAG TPA: hypothetical protein VFV93_09695 [Thermomicrobiales bacterium]|nr:hypothetical protein [Thermomicrobiales bacterium]
MATATSLRIEEPPEPMVPDSFHDRWNGRHWRWWALLAGVALTGLALALAAGLSAVREEDTAPLAFVIITLILFTISIAGSGMFDGLAARAISGGLARQPAPDARANRSSPSESESDRARRDRRTIRCGLAALPLAVTFLVLLFS